MKSLVPFLVSLAAFATAASGFGQTILASYDFESGGVTAPWFKAAFGGGSPGLSVSSSFVSDGGNLYGHYIVTTTSVASNPSALGFAGFFMLVPRISATNPPPSGWTDSFDVRQETLEPMVVALRLGSSGVSPTYIGWGTPSSSGWSHVSVSSDQFTQIPSP